MSKKQKKVEQEETELLEETKELEQDTKLNKEMLKLEDEITTLTDENKKLTLEKESLTKECERLTEKVKLAQAELVNYRRRKDEEVQNTLKYANQDLITELIPLVDNFERALGKDENALSDEVKKYLQGFRLMQTNLWETLKKFGVEEINRAGEVFDSKLEQALIAECNESLEDDVVIEVLQKGYKLKDRVIRPASVKINQK